MQVVARYVRRNLSTRFPPPPHLHFTNTVCRGGLMLTRAPVCCMNIFMAVCSGSAHWPPVPRAACGWRAEGKGQSWCWRPLPTTGCPRRQQHAKGSPPLGGRTVRPDRGQTSRRGPNPWLLCEGASGLSASEIPGSTQGLSPEKMADGYADHVSHQEKG